MASQQVCLKVDRACRDISREKPINSRFEGGLSQYMRHFRPRVRVCPLDAYNLKQ